ncbi:MAG: metallophosphoesterase [Clostridiales bacterium]|nr:metallophosphoesterase [Clostridiales bacterium]
MSRHSPHLRRVFRFALVLLCLTMVCAACRRTDPTPAENPDAAEGSLALPAETVLDETVPPETEAPETEAPETEAAPADVRDGFVPVIRLAVCSDTHITDTTNERAVRLGKLFDTAYRYADAHPTYQTLDAVLMAGDITNTGYESEFKALNTIVRKHIRPETQLITTMGNHEWIGGGPDVYRACMNDTLDPHVVINGFHIIGVSPRNTNNYPAAQIRWLKEELKAAAEDAPGMPIFTFQHHHIKDTVYVSRSWYTPDYPTLRKAYGAYPQVIDFSGDSHGPMNNPLSIWQEECTFLNTGTLYYFEMERGMTGGTLPPGKENAAQYYIVEADAEGRVLIQPFNILTDDFFKTPSNTDDPAAQLYYWIEKPSDPSTFLYTPDRGKTATAPYFEEGSEITLEKITESSVTVTVPQAKDDQCIYSYRLVAETDDHRKEVKYFSEYYFEPMPETVSCQVKALHDDKTYTVSVYPVNAWGVEGEPIRTSFETPASVIVPYETDNPVTYVGTFTDFESYKRLRRSTDNGVFSGEANGDYFAGEWNGAGTIRDTVLSIEDGHGYRGSKAGAVTVKASSHSNRGLYLFADAVNHIPQDYPSARYLRVWVDFTGIDFRKACFGFVTKYDELYSTDDIDGRTDLPFYCLAEGATEWKTMYHGTDGCFGAAQSSSVEDFKGWLAFPTADFAERTGSGSTFDSRSIKAVYMYFDLASDDMLSKPFYLDEIALVDDYRVFEEIAP